jgi:uncharacterized membrane protein YjgN (DUF898 family)/Flp pilus assembly protein TadD
MLPMILRAVAWLCGLTATIAGQEQGARREAAELVQQGRSWMEDGDYEKAVEAFSRALATAPDDGPALGWRGLTYARLGRLEEAEADLERAVAAPEPEQAWLEWYGYLLHLRDANDEARTVLRSALARMPSSWAYAVAASVEYERGAHQVALAHIDEAVRREPDSSEYHLTRAYCLSALGREAEAAAAQREALRLDPALEDAEVDAGAELLRRLLRVFVIGVCVLAALSLVALVFSGPRLAALGREPPAGTLAARYDGRARELFAIYLRNVVLTLLTAGAYRFWAKVHARRYHYQHTTFAGGRFDYHANGREKLVGFLMGLTMLAPIVGVLYFAYGALDERWSHEARIFAIGWLFAGTMYLLRPLILVGSQRYDLARTSWSNLRFRFTGRVPEAYRLYVRDLTAIVPSFGIYLPWHQCNVRRFRLAHTAMGKLHFSFEGRGAELLRITVVGVLLSYVTLGLYLPWHVARLRRFRLDNTRFRGRPFQSILTGGTVFVIGVPALLAVVATLGLALPWAAVRWRRLMTDTTIYCGELDSAILESIRDQRAGAAIDGLGEAGEGLAAIGDLLGG